MSRERSRAALLAGLCLQGIAMLLAPSAHGQAIDLSHGGQITVTAVGGFDWDQKAQTVTAYRQAQAVRGTATVTADRLIAFYRKKAGAATPAKPKPPGHTDAGQDTAEKGGTADKAGAAGKEGTAGAGGVAGDTGANEIYRLEAFGHVHIFTATDQAWGDHAIYDIDQAVLVLTGHALRLTTPTDVLTARDVMEYWSRTRMSVGRGDASVTTNDARRIRADVLVGYSAPADAGKTDAGKAASARLKPAAAADPIQSSGKLQKVDAFGHVVVRTLTETVTGDRGVYVPDTGIARIVGNVHITRGQNQLNGAAAIVNMHTGLATMTEDPGARVQGLIVPNESSSAAPAPGSPAPGSSPVPGSSPAPPSSSAPVKQAQP